MAVAAAAVGLVAGAACAAEGSRPRLVGDPLPPLATTSVPPPLDGTPGTPGGTSPSEPPTTVSPVLGGLVLRTDAAVAVVDPGGRLRPVLPLPAGVQVAPLAVAPDGAWVATVLARPGEAPTVVVASLLPGDTALRSYACDCARVAATSLGFVTLDRSRNLLVIPPDGGGGVLTIATDLPERASPPALLGASGDELYVRVAPADPRPGDAPRAEVVLLAVQGAARTLGEVPGTPTAAWREGAGPVVVATRQAAGAGSACPGRDEVWFVDAGGSGVALRAPLPDGGPWQVPALGGDGTGTPFAVLAPAPGPAGAAGAGSSCAAAGPPVLAAWTGAAFSAVGGGFGDGVRAVAAGPQGRLAFARDDRVAVSTPDGAAEAPVGAADVAWRPVTP